jgi:hypothetical protein
MQQNIASGDRLAAPLGAEQTNASRRSIGA